MASPNRFLALSDDAGRPTFNSELTPLLRRLQALTVLSPENIATIGEISVRSIRDIAPRSDIHREGDYPPPTVILSGWACRQRLLPDGRRQIISFLLPGDIVGILPPCLPAPCAAVALTRVRVADASSFYRATLGIDPSQPGLAQGLRILQLLDESVLRDQVTRLGRQTAYERFANLLLELYSRLQTVGLASDGQFALPLTQEVLADALGLSVVHVNRTVQQMRRDRLVELRSGVVVITQPDALRSIADWEPHRTKLNGA
jgi:CRP-like cAMP-binding protein